MDVELKKDGTWAVLRLAGSLNAAAVDRLRNEWQGWFKANPAVQTIVVDLAAVGFVDSSGLGLLVALLKWTGERGGDVKIANLLKTVRLVFEITRTHKVFEIYDSVDEALRAG